MSDLYQVLMIRQRNELAYELMRERKRSATLAVICAGLCIALLCVVL